MTGSSGFQVEDGAALRTSWDEMLLLLLLSDVLKRVKMWGRGAEAAFRGTEGELRCFEPYLNVPEAGLRLY